MEISKIPPSLYAATLIRLLKEFIVENIGDNINCFNYCQLKPELLNSCRHSVSGIDLSI